jgi:hypothetical protein
MKKHLEAAVATSLRIAEQTVGPTDADSLPESNSGLAFSPNLCWHSAVRRHDKSAGRSSPRKARVPAPTQRRWSRKCSKRQGGQGRYPLRSGPGDGRIVIAAAKESARGVGVDIDPERSRVVKTLASVADTEVSQQDLFETDIREATVVTPYLWPEINLRLRPKLLSDLKPGTRVVSHNHDMGDWKPLKTVRVRVPHEYLISKTLNMRVPHQHKIYYWIVPPHTHP